MLEFYNYNTRTAKKEYQCDLCGEKINVGEKYVRYSGKYDGYMFDDKYHTQCKGIIDKYCRNQGEYEYDEWCVHDWLKEGFCDDLCNEDERDECSCMPYRCPKILRVLFPEQPTEARNDA